MIELLELAGCVIVRVNGGRLPNPSGRPVKMNTVHGGDLVFDENGRQVKPTCSDLIVWFPGGRTVAVEVKRPGEKATPGQGAFLASVAARGGLTAVVASVEDAAALLRG